jgi:hypothetical protein
MLRNSLYIFENFPSVTNSERVTNSELVELGVQTGRVGRPVSLANREAVLHIFDVRRPLSLVSLCKVHR